MRTFKKLTNTNVSGLTATLKGKDCLGDGYTRMPWYWHVNLNQVVEEQDAVLTSGQAVPAEYDKSKSSMCHVKVRASSSG
jgi:hypothetical protein